jgi:hypothetical protein
VETVAKLNGRESGVIVPGKRALLNAENGAVRGIVSLS